MKYLIILLLIILIIYLLYNIIYPYIQNNIVTHNEKLTFNKIFNEYSLKEIYIIYNCLHNHYNNKYYKNKNKFNNELSNYINCCYKYI